MVIVQPSTFGTDNNCTLDAVDLLGREKSRAVVVIDDSFDHDALEQMDAKGARGVRFNAVSGNGTPLDQLENLAARVAELGWHIQFYTHGEQVAELAHDVGHNGVHARRGVCSGLRCRPLPPSTRS